MCDRNMVFSVSSLHNVFRDFCFDFCSLILKHFWLNHLSYFINKNWFKVKHVWIWCFSPVKRVSLEFKLWFSIAFPHLKEPLEGRWD